ncbi:MAG: hypothetical protein WCO11_05940 [Sphingomonadales bacterium]|jgi:hypothetical protein
MAKILPMKGSVAAGLRGHNWWIGEGRHYRHKLSKLLLNRENSVGWAYKRFGNNFVSF